MKLSPLTIRSWSRMWERTVSLSVRAVVTVSAASLSTASVAAADFMSSTAVPSRMVWSLSSAQITDAIPVRSSAPVLASCVVKACASSADRLCCAIPETITFVRIVRAFSPSRLSALASVMAAPKLMLMTLPLTVTMPCV